MSVKIQIRFGVPWLDAWFSAAEEDEKLGETFLRFSRLSNFDKDDKLPLNKLARFCTQGV